MKRILSCAISLLFIICAAPPALAMIMPPFSENLPPQPSAPVTITSIWRDYNGRDTFPLLTISKGEPLSALSTQLQNNLSVLSCLTDQIDASGQPQCYFCPVEWVLPDTADTSTPGRIEIHGTLKPESNYFLADGLSADITWQAVVTGERAQGAETLSDIAVDIAQDLPIALGEAPKSNVTDATCHTSIPGEYFFCDFTWDFTDVDINKAGKYTVSGAPTLPPGFALPLGYIAPVRTVVVMHGDRPDLSAAVYDNINSVIRCKWLFALQKDNDVHAEYAIGKGEWQQDTNETHMSYNSYWGKSLIVKLASLDVKTDYYFRLRYTEDGTEKLSNLLHIYLDNKDFLLPDSVPPTFDIGGDRDAGDTGGSPLPPIQQPIPVPSEPTAPPPASSEPTPTSPALPDKPTSQPNIPVTILKPAPEAPIMEQVTEDSTLISGLRLAQLIALGDEVLFEKHGIAVELSSSFLSGLHLNNDSILEVYIKKTENDGFSLAVFTDGNAVSALPNTVVYLPLRANDDDELECIKPDGGFVAKAYYQKLDGTARFELQEGGTYLVQPVKAPTAKAPSEAISTAPVHSPDSSTAAAVPQAQGQSRRPVFILTAILGIGVCACLYVFILRQRHE